MDIENDAKNIILEGLKKAITYNTKSFNSSMGKLIDRSNVIDTSSKNLGFSKIIRRGYTP